MKVTNPWSPAQFRRLRKIRSFIDHECLYLGELKAYDDLAQWVNSARSDIYNSTALKKIVEQDLLERRYLRTAAIVSKNTLIPNEAFFLCVEQFTGKPIKNRRAFWLKQIRGLGIKLPENHPWRDKPATTL